MWVQMHDITFFFQLLKSRCYGNQFLDQIGNIDLLHLNLSHWYLKMDCSIVTMTGTLTVAIIPLHLEENWQFSVQ